MFFKNSGKKKNSGISSLTSFGVSIKSFQVCAIEWN